MRLAPVDIAREPTFPGIDSDRMRFEKRGDHRREQPFPPTLPGERRATGAATIANAKQHRFDSHAAIFTKLFHHRRAVGRRQRTSIFDCASLWLVVAAFMRPV